MEVAYISGPYRADTVNGIWENVQAARKIALKYWRLGYAVVCPHMNTAMMDGACPDDAWLKGHVEIMLRCDVVVMMEGWEWSKGAIEECKAALRNGLEIVYLEKYTEAEVAYWNERHLGMKPRPFKEWEDEMKGVRE